MEQRKKVLLVAKMGGVVVVVVVVVVVRTAEHTSQMCCALTVPKNLGHFVLCKKLLKVCTSLCQGRESYLC